MSSSLILQGKIIAILVVSLFIITTTNIYATDDTVIVSLGDSYSSGEGIEEFYDQNKPLEEKVQSIDWLAHRSKNSWPGMLKGTNGEPMKRGENWFFVATSGATTFELDHPFTKKYYRTRTDAMGRVIADPLRGKLDIPAQLDIFDDLKKKGIEADYVTITIGGNDLGFSKIMKKAATEASFYKRKGKQTELEALLENAWETFTDESEDETSVKDDIRNAYEEIENAAGKQATIIVAGYPKLLDEDRTALTLFSRREAIAINGKVEEFNTELENLVGECKGSGMNIVFVPIMPAFTGREAYSKNPAINNIELLKEDDIYIDGGPVPISDYSFHPNINGAKLYAKCVQAEIVDKEDGVSSEGETDVNETSENKVNSIHDQFNRINVIGKTYSSIEEQFGPLEYASGGVSLGEYESVVYFTTTDGFKVGFFTPDLYGYNYAEEPTTENPDCICVSIMGTADSLLGIKGNQELSDEELAKELSADYIEEGEPHPINGEVNDNAVVGIKKDGERDIQIYRMDLERGTPITKDTFLTIDYASYLITW